MCRKTAASLSENHTALHFGISFSLIQPVVLRGGEEEGWREGERAERRGSREEVEEEGGGESIARRRRRRG